MSEIKTKVKAKKIKLPPQHQNKQPGIEEKMIPEPVLDDPDYKGRASQWPVNDKRG